MCRQNLRSFLFSFKNFWSSFGRPLNEFTVIVVIFLAMVSRNVEVSLFTAFSKSKTESIDGFGSSIASYSLSSTFSSWLCVYRRWWGRFHLVEWR